MIMYEGRGLWCGIMVLVAGGIVSWVMGWTCVCGKRMADLLQLIVSCGGAQRSNSRVVETAKV